MCCSTSGDSQRHLLESPKGASIQPPRLARNRSGRKDDLIGNLDHEHWRMLYPVLSCSN
jgi:hypothetical protein